jgi:tetratricopeptide (TPR) repeat protein
MERLMVQTWSRRIGQLSASALCMSLLLAGCGAPVRPAPGPVKAIVLPPLQPPANFDRQRAGLSLSQVPDDPPAPVASAAASTTELPPAVRRDLAEARQLFRKGQHAECIAALEKVLGLDASCAEAHRLTALACLLSGNDERAGLSAKRTVELRPDDLVAHYVVGRLAEKRRDTANAIRAFRLAIKCKASPDDADYLVLTHYHLGLLLDQERYYEAATEQLAMFDKGVRSLGPRVEDNPELASIVRLQRGATAVRLARAYSYLGNYPAAADALKVAVQEAPKDLQLRADYVSLLAHAGRLEQAMAESRRFVSDSQGNREAVELLLAVHRAAGRPEAGVAAIRDVVAQQPDNLELHLLYCDALVDARRYEQAVSTLKDLVSRFPKATDASWKLIEIQRLRQDWPGWLLALSQMLAAEPVEYERAGRELDQAPVEVARRIADEASNRGKGRHLVPPEPVDAGESAALDYLLGRLCDRLDRVDDARRLFDEASRRLRGFLPATMGVAELYIRRCRWDDAIAVLKSQKAASDAPSHLLERLLGQCYDGLDDDQKAVEHYEAAVKISSDDVRSIMMLARLYERMERNREAQQQYQAAITANQNYMPAREAYIRSLMSANAGATSAVAAGRVALEFAEMQRRGSRDPATIRTAALLRFLQDRNRQSYCDILRSLVQAHPDDERSFDDLAATLVTFRDYGPAREVLTTMVAAFPRSGQAGWMMAVTLTHLLDFDGAAAEFERILTLHPNRQSYLYGLAELRMTQQQFNAAIPVYERLLKLQDTEEFPGVIRGRLMEAYRRVGRLDDARRLAQMWLKEIDPKSKTAAAYRSVARWFLLAADEAAKDYDGYLRRCREWLEADAKDATVRAWLIGMTTEAPVGTVGQFSGPAGLVGAGRYDEAATHLLKWMGEPPGDSRQMRSLSEVLLAARRFDEAVELERSLVASTAKDEDRLVLLYSLQATYLRARRYDDAIATVRDWINTAQKLVTAGRGASREELDGAIFEQRRTVGTLMAQMGRADDAIAYLTAMLEREDDDSRQVELLRGLSYVLQRQGRLDLAEEHLRQAYELMPADVGLNNDLGYTLADTGKDLPEAERMLRMVVGESPRQAAYLDSLGWVFYKQGKFQDAARWLGLAAGSEDGQDAVIYDHRGDALWRTADKDAAVKSWRRSLELYERQVADGQTDVNAGLVERLKGKIAAAGAGGTPLVAGVGAQQASTPSP